MDLNEIFQKIVKFGGQTSKQTPKTDLALSFSCYCELLGISNPTENDKNKWLETASIDRLI
jgi:hypothetical protein